MNINKTIYSTTELPKNLRTPAYAKFIVDKNIPGNTKISPTAALNYIRNTYPDSTTAIVYRPTKN